MTDKWPPGEYRTRAGWRAYVLGTLPEMDEGIVPVYAIRGFVLSENVWIPMGWKRNGDYVDTSEHDRDLMLPPETCWAVRYYTDGGYKGILLYQDRVSAEYEATRCMKAKGYNDVEVIRMVEGEWGNT